MQVTSGGGGGGSATALEEINRVLRENYTKRDEVANEISFGSLPEMAKFEFGNDGTFWMDVRDFTKHYSTLFVLRDLPTGEWEGKRIDGQWTVDDSAEGGGGSAGGSPVNPTTFLTNPQYMVTVTAPETEVLVLLEQPDLRMCYEGKTDPFSSAAAPPMFPDAIGMVVVKVAEEEAATGLTTLRKEDVVGMTRAWCMQRDVSLEITLNKPGTYVRADEPRLKCSSSLAHSLSSVSVSHLLPHLALKRPSLGCCLLTYLRRDVDRRCSGWLEWNRGMDVATRRDLCDHPQHLQARDCQPFPHQPVDTHWGRQRLHRRTSEGCVVGRGVPSHRLGHERPRVRRGDAA